MKLTKEHIVELFRELSPDIECDYVIQGDFSSKVKSVTDDYIYLSLLKKGIDQNKDIPLSADSMVTLANNVKENLPISIDAALCNAGNKRSAIEGVLIRTSEFYSIKKNNNKMIVWVPSYPHKSGVKGIWPSDKPLPLAEPEVEDLLTLKQIDVRNDYTIEELGQFLSKMSLMSKFGIGVTCVAFGFKYGESIIKQNYKAGELIDEANKYGVTINHTQEGTINEGITLFQAVKEQAFGIRFAKSPIKIFSDDNIKDDNILPLLCAIRTKPFVLLAGISGTGKSRIVRKLAQATVKKELAPEIEGDDAKRWELPSPANFQLIQVKPNWHNSMDVVGYLSNIPEPHYVFTPFVEFIIKAMQYPFIPFFLCLDEMNLAPVEEYFAEFLSAIESRSCVNKEYFTDPLIKPFNSFGENVCNEMIRTFFPEYNPDKKDNENEYLIDRLKNQGLMLPQNLIVIGTVNMDETTFSFSRKVLDRAMSIEMNDVDYDSFLSGSTDDELKTVLEKITQRHINKYLIYRPINAIDILSDEKGNLSDSDSKFVIDYLKRVNSLLDGTPFKLGYRAANEALLYLSASYKFNSGDRVKAMDNFTLMKILSRIEGDQSKLKLTDSKVDTERLEKAGVKIENAKNHGELTILTAMRELIKSSLLKYPDISSDTRPDNQETHNADSLNSIKKIDSMISQLERDHFVSYWN